MHQKIRLIYKKKSGGEKNRLTEEITVNYKIH
jgi:hypothetical protein